MRTAPLASLVAIFLLPSFVRAQGLTREFLAAQLVQDATQKVDSIGAPPGRCSSSAVTAVHFTNLLKKHQETLVRDTHGNMQTLSVLTDKEAKELQAYVNADENLAAHFTEDGCEQRAIETNRILRTQGIKSGSIEAYPGGFQGSGSFRADFPGSVPGVVWTHHVAPTIAVRENGQVVIKVIDPVFSSAPLTKAQWLAKLRQRSESGDPVDFYLTKDAPYSEDVVEKASAQLRFYRDIQRQREALPPDK